MRLSYVEVCFFTLSGKTSVQQTKSFMMLRDGSQFTSTLILPLIDGGIAFDSTVESQQFRSHRRSIFAFWFMFTWHPPAASGFQPRRHRELQPPRRSPTPPGRHHGGCHTLGSFTAMSRQPHASRPLTPLYASSHPALVNLNSSIELC